MFLFLPSLYNLCGKTEFVWKVNWINQGWRIHCTFTKCYLNNYFQIKKSPPPLFLNTVMTFCYYPKVASAIDYSCFSTIKILFMPPRKLENDQNIIALLIGSHNTIKWKGLA